jgi:hypothetical protein
MTRGKTVVLAATERIAHFGDLVEDFMGEVFDLLPTEYLITDESTLSDFTEFGSSKTSPIWRQINEIYGIKRADVPSERLVDILAEIRIAVGRLRGPRDASPKS